MTEPVVVDKRRVRAAVLPALAVGPRFAVVPVAASAFVSGLGADLGIPIPARAAVGRALVLFVLRERAPVCREPLLPVVVGAVLEEGAAVGVLAGGLCVCVDFFCLGGGRRGQDQRRKKQAAPGKRGARGAREGPSRREKLRARESELGIALE